jgi:heme/copper-type cytochrome/quinol oxidase subunit 2
MEQDATGYDSLTIRPLPKWLTDQRDSLNIVRPVKLQMKEDNSLGVSFFITGVIIFLIITILTIYILKKNKNKSL